MIDAWEQQLDPLRAPKASRIDRSLHGRCRCLVSVTKRGLRWCVQPLTMAMSTLQRRGKFPAVPAQA